MRLTVIFSVILVVLLIGYIAIIKLECLYIVEKAGIDTSGRVTIYNAVVEASPVSRSFWVTESGF